MLSKEYAKKHGPLGIDALHQCRLCQKGLKRNHYTIGLHLQNRHVMTVDAYEKRFNLTGRSNEEGGNELLSKGISIEPLEEEYLSDTSDGLGNPGLEDEGLEIDQGEGGDTPEKTTGDDYVFWCQICNKSMSCDQDIISR